MSCGFRVDEIGSSQIFGKKKRWPNSVVVPGCSQLSRFLFVGMGFLGFSLGFLGFSLVVWSIYPLQEGKPEVFTRPFEIFWGAAAVFENQQGPKHKS